VFDYPLVVPSRFVVLPHVVQELAVVEAHIAGDF
jgi:hypothetical protein